MQSLAAEVVALEQKVLQVRSRENRLGFTDFATNAIIGVSVVVAKDVSHAEPGSRGSRTGREGAASAQPGDPA